MARNERESCASSRDTRLNLEQRITRIRQLNDAFRKSGVGGRFILTAGIIGLGQEAAEAIVTKVRAFDAFTADNDLYHEHHMGSVQEGGQRIFWKIDYYDASLQFGSPDPADPSVTTRVLTIMLVSEY